MSSSLSVTLWRSKILEPEITYGGGGGGGSPLVFTLKVTLQKTNRFILSDDTVTVLPDNENSLRSSPTLSIDPYESSWHQSLRLEIRSLLSSVDTIIEDSILDKVADKVDDMIEFHNCHVHLTVAIEIVHDIYQSLVYDDDDNDNDKEADLRRSLQRVQAEDYMEVDGEEEEEDKCGICLGDMLLNKNKRSNQEGAEEEVVSLPCQHAFHDTCVVKWLKIKPFCPLCCFKLSVAATKPRRSRWRTIYLR